MAAQSFKSHLDHCRKLVQQEPSNAWTAFDLAVLDRWQDHDNANAAWEAIQKAAVRGGNKPLWPGDLVEWVIERAHEQKRIVGDIVPESTALENRVLSEAEKNWRRSRKGDGDLALLAGLQSRAALEHRANRQRVLGRQPNPRKLLIRACRDLLIMNCGQPLDEVIEMLVFVATGVEPKDNEVRDALKATTRRGRTPEAKNSR